MVKTFLLAKVTEPAAGAANEICYSVEAAYLYAMYCRWCREMRLMPAGKVEFLRVVLQEFPMAKFCDIRGQKWFTGIAYGLG